MSTTILTVLGLTMLYAWIHTAILIFTRKEYDKRTLYEKIITIYAFIMLVLYIIGTLV